MSSLISEIIKEVSALTDPGNVPAACRKETEDANRRLEESKLIARAQSVYAKKEHVSESDAYQVLRKTAMDKRLPLAGIAKAYLEQEEPA